MYKELSEKEEWLGKELVDIAYAIHSQLGPGLLESVYEKCFCYELSLRNIFFEKQKLVPIIYKQLKVENGLRLDLLVEHLVIVELKAQDDYHLIWYAQTLSYLKLTKKRLAYLINFHVPLIKEGIKRIIL